MTLDFLDHTRLYLGLYEIELVRHLRRLCRPGVRCFDVGGAIGYDALLLVKLGAERVVTFEADRAVAGALAANVSLNGLEDMIEVRAEPVGRGFGFTELDAVARAAFVPDLVKIDVDGAEAQVLGGAGDLIASARSSFIIETHTPELEQECGEILARAGYRPVIVHQRGVLPDRRPLAHNRWLVADRAAQRARWRP